MYNFYRIHVTLLTQLPPRRNAILNRETRAYTDDAFTILIKVTGSRGNFRNIPRRLIIKYHGLSRREIASIPCIPMDAGLAVVRLLSPVDFFRSTLCAPCASSASNGELFYVSALLLGCRSLLDIDANPPTHDPFLCLLHPDKRPFVSWIVACTRGRYVRFGGCWRLPATINAPLSPAKQKYPVVRLWK